MPGFVRRPSAALVAVATAAWCGAGEVACGAPAPDVAAQRDESDRNAVELALSQVEARPAVRARIALAAQSFLRMLLARHPGDPWLHILQSRVYAWIADERGSENASPDQVALAVAELEKARQLAPDGPHGELIAAELGILCSKLGQFQRALDEYERAGRLHAGVRLAADESDQANLVANSAETVMALGRLDEAIDRYRAAAEMNPSPRTRILAFYGLAVACDRDQQRECAREAIGRALDGEKQIGDRALGALEDPDVFFMPRGEVHYYRALAELHLGRDAAAAVELRQFLEALPDSPWAGRAKERLAELTGAAPDSRTQRFRLTFGRVVSPGRESARLSQMLARSAERVKGCFDRADFLDEGTSGDLVLVVTRMGKVSEVLGIPSGPLSGHGGACLVGIAKTWLFGRGESGLLAIPLELAAR